jgi:carboxypeptidase C (cathepsin A)
MINTIHNYLFSCLRAGWAVSVCAALLLSGCGDDVGRLADTADDSADLGLAGIADQATEKPADQPYFDPIAYGKGAEDSINDANEHAAITHNEVTIDGQTIPYTAKAGHLVTYDPTNSQPSAKIFYVSYTAKGQDTGKRPVIFLYNGGPGSPAIWLHLGSFSPVRVVTSSPDFTPPAPYTLEPNSDSLLDKADLVFINPVGTGYSTAIAPYKNKDFWGVDKDTDSLKQFIKRYLTANGRWNSPKFLFGESYGGPRSAVLSYKLYQDGIYLNGMVLLSPGLDYTQEDNPVGLLPTYAANAWHHKKINVHPVPKDLPSFMAQVTSFASGDYAAANKEWVALDKQKSSLHVPLVDEKNPEIKAAINEFKQQYPKIEEQLWVKYLNYLLQRPKSTEQTKALVWQLDKVYGKINAFPALYDAIAQQVSDLIGIDKAQVKKEHLMIDNGFFKRNLLPGLSIGGYDGRFTTTDEGIASKISLINNDATDRGITGVYIAAWNTYLNQTLKYTSNAAFLDEDSRLNFSDTAHGNWDWTHRNPVGNTTQTRGELNTTIDLAAVMSVNPDLRIFTLSGYHDDVTPWYQTRLDLQNMSLAPKLRKNIQSKEYPSGHMIFLDPASRTAMKADLAKFFEASVADRAAVRRILQLQKKSLSKQGIRTEP